MAPSEDELKAALGRVIDPELRRPVTELDMVRGVEVADGHVAVTIALTVAGCPLRSSFQDQVARELGALEGVDSVSLEFDVMTPAERQALTTKLRGGITGRSKGLSLDASTRVLAIVSGKGGVGKSSVTVNLAAALSGMGQRVGVLDADVYGHSIPHLLGIHQKPVLVDRMIVPPVRRYREPQRSIPSARPVVSDGGANESAPLGDGIASDALKLMSIGFFLEDNDPVMWRGPMLHKALEQFLSDVHWGELDTLVVDMPPGTGDVSISLGQLLPRAEAIVVTTPQPLALEVASRAATMARKTSMRLVGVVENMAGDVFGSGGGEELAATLETPFLGRVPLDPLVRECGDIGEPLVWAHPESAPAREIAAIAEAVSRPQAGTIVKPLTVVA